jgi:aminoglycoside 3-N-acetyltransferase
MINTESITRNLSTLGVRAGDILFVRSNLLRIVLATSTKRVASPTAEVIRNGFLNALGPEGTLIVPAFTRISKRWSKEKHSFSSFSPTNSGALSSSVLKHPEKYRSTHPTHSFAAIGPLARDILGDHDETKTPFYPFQKLIALDIKMLLVGCNEESPGFPTVHYVQSELGLSRRHWGRYLYDVRYEKDGRSVKWIPPEHPGCSRGFDKMYPSYIRTRNFITGQIGSAYSILVQARGAYEVERNILSKDPLAVLCDRDDCYCCLLRGYNLKAIPKAVARKIARPVFIRTSPGQRLRD